MYQYSVPFRLDNTKRKYRVTVVASDPDEARQLAAIRFPNIIAFGPGYPRRGKAVVEAK